MGACFSSHSNDQKPSANVVSVTGELRQYAIPVTVAQILQSETETSESFFICDSDLLYFDDYIPSLNLDDQLRSDQIYFVLPSTKLRYKLAASDMAALAVKASIAIEKINASAPQRNGKARVSPVLVVAEEELRFDEQIQSNEKTRMPSSGFSRSGSLRKLHRYSSRRAKLTVRSFKVKLNTIFEGSVFVN